MYIIWTAALDVSPQFMHNSERTCVESLKHARNNPKSGEISIRRISSFALFSRQAQLETRANYRFSRLSRTFRDTDRASPNCCDLANLCPGVWLILIIAHITSWPWRFCTRRLVICGPNREIIILRKRVLMVWFTALSCAVVRWRLILLSLSAN